MSQRSPSEASELQVPQPYVLRAASLLNAFLCFVFGGFGGLAGTTAGRTLWFGVGLVWLAWYFWALAVPYMKISDDRVLLRPMPFSGGEASIRSISGMSFGEKLVEVSQVGGVTLKIRLDRVSRAHGSDVLSMLRRLEQRAEELDRSQATEFEANWGVDPERQQTSDLGRDT